MMHSDIVEPLEPSLLDQYRYTTIFLDFLSQYLYIGLMACRSEKGVAFDTVSAKLRGFSGTISIFTTPVTLRKSTLMV